MTLGCGDFNAVGFDCAQKEDLMAQHRLQQQRLTSMKMSWVFAAASCRNISRIFKLTAAAAPIYLPATPRLPPSKRTSNQKSLIVQEQGSPSGRTPPAEMN
jgi:hypothetical protein